METSRVVYTDERPVTSFTILKCQEFRASGQTSGDLECLRDSLSEVTTTVKYVPPHPRVPIPVEPVTTCRSLCRDPTLEPGRLGFRYEGDGRSVCVWSGPFTGVLHPLSEHGPGRDPIRAEWFRPRVPRIFPYPRRGTFSCTNPTWTPSTLSVTDSGIVSTSPLLFRLVSSLPGPTRWKVLTPSRLTSGGFLPVRDRGSPVYPYPLSTLWTNSKEWRTPGILVQDPFPTTGLFNPKSLLSRLRDLPTPSEGLSPPEFDPRLSPYPLFSKPFP